jgi:hypothetical protein
MNKKSLSWRSGHTLVETDLKLRFSWWRSCGNLARGSRSGTNPIVRTPSPRILRSIQPRGRLNSSPCSKGTRRRLKRCAYLDANAHCSLPASIWRRLLIQAFCCDWVLSFINEGMAIAANNPITESRQISGTGLISNACRSALLNKSVCNGIVLGIVISFPHS